MLRLLASARLELLLLCGALCGGAETLSPEMQRQLLDMATCALELQVSRSPGHYIIATVEHTGKLECSAQPCVEELHIVRLFALRRPDGKTAVSSFWVLSTSIAQSFPPGTRTIGSFVPTSAFPGPTPESRVGQEVYAGTEATPVLAETEAVYEEAVKRLVAAAPGAPDCHMTASPSS